MSPPNGTSIASPHAFPDVIAVAEEIPGPDADLAVVIPTRNNELAIGSLVHLARYCSGLVVVADDASDDRTVEIAKRAGAAVVTADSPGGRANAILAGCRHSLDLGFTAIALLDPQASHLVQEIPRLALPVLAGKADLVVGSRNLVGRKALQAYPNATADDAGGPREGFPVSHQCTDPKSAFRVLSGRAVATILDLLPADEEFEPAMVTLLSRRGLAVRDLAITVRTALDGQHRHDLPMYRGKRVAVVMPAYNEELLIGDTLSGVPDFVARVYVVNDSSTDGTRDVIEHYAQQDPSILPINHETNGGPGAAIRDGYRAALEDGMDIVATMDGDNQMDPRFLPELLDPIIDGKCDYTKGNRLASAEYRKGMSTWRFFGNTTLTLLTKFASGYWQLMDPQNGYTAISSRALERIDIDGIYPRYGYLNDILVKLNVQGFRVVNVPHPARYGREKSHIRYSTYIPRVSRLLVRDFLWRLKTKYIVLSFHPLVFYYFLGVSLSLIGLLIGVYALWYRFIEHHPIFVPATIALIIFALGTHYWLFAMLFDMRQERENNGWY